MAPVKEAKFKFVVQVNQDAVAVDELFRDMVGRVEEGERAKVLA